MNVSSALKDGKADFFEDERASLRNAFLKRERCEKEPLTPLPVDASKRRYFRLPHALVMDAPPPDENTISFHQIAEFLESTGLSVPRIYAADHVHGFLLLEDLGEMTYRKAIQTGLSETLLYGETMKALIHLHQQVKENKFDFPLYTFDAFFKEVEVFIDWYDIPLTQQSKQDFKDIWRDVYETQPTLPQSFVLRDVLIDNLLWLPSRIKLKRSGFIDFQDGLWGPITYDLVSLLEDARRDISLSFAQGMLDLYLQAFPSLKKEDFLASYCLWGAQRCTKILGVFSRLAKRDGKYQYLSHIPRVWAYLERDLQHPSLKPIREWFKKVFP